MAPINARLTEFLSALDHSLPEEFVTAPGLGVFKAKHIKRGIERGVIVEHHTGMGLAILQPKSHGICRECADSKGRSICGHCRCEMCVWFRVTDELSSPRVSRERMQQLVARLKTFEIGGTPPVVTEPALDSEI